MSAAEFREFEKSVGRVTSPQGVVRAVGCSAHIRRSSSLASYLL